MLEVESRHTEILTVLSYRKTNGPKDPSTCILTSVLIKVLYAVLVVSMLALLWAAGASYMRVRRHLAARHEGAPGGAESVKQTET